MIKEHILYEMDFYFQAIIPVFYCIFKSEKLKYTAINLILKKPHYLKQNHY